MSFFKATINAKRKMSRESQMREKLITKKTDFITFSSLKKTLIEYENSLLRIFVKMTLKSLSTFNKYSGILLSEKLAGVMNSFAYQSAV